MDRNDDGNFLVSREEQRAFKHAAAINGDMELVKLFAHYRAIRQTSRADREALLKFTVREDSLLMQEARSLDELVYRPTMSVHDMRYVYGPRLADVAIQGLIQAADTGMLTPRESTTAVCVTARYELLTQELATQD